MLRSCKKAECVELGSIVFNRLMDLKEELQNDLRALLRACKVDDLDQVQDNLLYSIGCELTHNAQELGRVAEDLNSVLEDISKIDLSKC